MTQKSISYSPNWRLLRKEFIISILLIPVLGVGLILFFRYKKRLNREIYFISDTEISIHSGGEQTRILFEHLTGVEVRDHIDFMGQKVASIVIATSKGTFVLKALKEYALLGSALEQILAQVESHRKIVAERKKIEVKQDPGSLERLNDLMGMWQAGLLSDEAYLTEKKKFE